MLFFYVLLFIQNVFSLKVYCPLQWVAQSGGIFPDGSVLCSEFTNTYVGRVFIDDKWIIGTLFPSLGKLKAVVQSNGNYIVQEYSSYQVLVEKSYCQFDWLEDKAGSVPMYAVPVNQDEPMDGFIGQTKSYEESETFCGLTRQLEGSTKVATRFDRQEDHITYRSLISIYPPLIVELSDFIFDMSNFKKKNIKEKLMGEMEVQIQGGSSNSAIDLEIDHSKLFTEFFIIKENLYDWIGIYSVNISTDLFYGTESLLFKELIVDNKDLLVYERTNIIGLKLRYKGEGPAQSSYPKTKVEICSVINVLENIEFPFVAKAIYRTNPGIEPVYVKNILDKLVRDYDDKAENGGVHGKFEGVLSGKFAISTSLHINDISPKKIFCSSYRG